MWDLIIPGPSNAPHMWPSKMSAGSQAAATVSFLLTQIRMFLSFGESKFYFSRTFKSSWLAVTGAALFTRLNGGTL